MATAIKRPASPTPPAVPAAEETTSSANLILRSFDAIYRFLASLKLAVIALSSVAAVLALGTGIERQYGTVAVQEWVYRTWWFAVLLAFLGTNILCAALIRYPWTKRQTGFVITHTGLLVVLAGAFWSFQYADEGQVGIVEGQQSDLLLKPDHPVIRLREVDPHTHEVVNNREYVMPFRPGALAWDDGRYELLSDPKDPFKLAVKNHLTAASRRYVHEQVPQGLPMVQLGILFKAPNMPRETDLFARDPSGGSRWFVVEAPSYRSARTVGPAVLAFQFLDSPEKLDAFLNPPRELGKDGVALIRYKDRDGKSRVETWPIRDSDKGQPRQLPDSDLTITFEDTAELPLPADSHTERLTGGLPIHLAEFQVRKGDSPPVKHFGWSGLPMLTSLPAVTHDADSGQREELLHIDYVRPLPPGQMGLIEVAGMPDGKLYYRSINSRGLKSAGPLEMGRLVTALGGNDSPMSLKLEVDQYYLSGRRRLTYVQQDLPVGEINKGIPGAFVELTINGETESLWLLRGGGFDAEYKTLTFPSGKTYELAYDVERQPLGFTLALDDFDVGLDPGTSEPSSYRSDIRLTDEGMKIKDKPITISMNNTMTHRGWTFYQSNYIPLTDENDNKTGQYMSVFQVGHDPGRPLKYAGCLLVVCGVFVQFYMRAGVFTDGGKKERERAAARAARRAKADGQALPLPATEVASDVEPL